jgi:hypothetical protein
MRMEGNGETEKPICGWYIEADLKSRISFFLKKKGKKLKISLCELQKPLGSSLLARLVLLKSLHFVNLVDFWDKRIAAWIQMTGLLICSYEMGM